MKMIPLKKQSKRSQREYHAAQRGSWNGLCPVTRVVPNKKAYNRNKATLTSRRDILAGDCLAYTILLGMVIGALLISEVYKADISSSILL